MAKLVETAFEKELEIFRTEEEIAQQYFFAYLSVRSLAAKNQDVLRAMNKTPLFWITTHHAMLLSAFIALGRIFDQKSKHNIDHLMSIALESLLDFGRTELAVRKHAAGLSKQEAANYAADSHELTPADLRVLRKEIKRWRGVYVDRYRDVRNQAFAHKELGDIGDVNKLLAKTKVDELKDLFGFLSALYSALWEQFHNGRKAELDIRQWILPPERHPTWKEMLPGERVYREGQSALLSTAAGDEIRERHLTNALGSATAPFSSESG